MHHEGKGSLVSPDADSPTRRLADSRSSPVDRLIRFCLTNKLVVFLGVFVMIAGGWAVAPFDWESGIFERSPVPVDAIPDTGENQQIVFTEWPGRSPQDIEDQITYPLTTALLGLPEVKTVRSFSMFGFSSIYIIFDEGAEFYWTRSRILEKLNSLPPDLLPEGVAPILGPDATALGQVFWYTLEGRDPQGNATDGWGLDELRSIQDWYVRYALQGVEGVAEVASAGGYVREYQIDIDPNALRAFGITLNEVFDAVRNSNIDVGANTIEVNRVEYLVRGLGFIENLDDLRQTVVAVRENVPVTLDQLAEIEVGPAMRRGALDKGGAEVVGGVVVTRFGENPLEVIKRVKVQIERISPGLPSKTLEDGTLSQVSIVPFYDRTGLIYETLGTLETAVRQEILITIIVVVIMVMHLRSSLLISGVLPLAVLFSFIGMRLFGVDANIVALSGIAIAIGTIVDMGIVIVENILEHLEKADPEESRLEVVYRACSEVGSAVLTAVLTTVISFLPVFTMEAAEGKMFRPLAYTKTFALIGSIVVALTIIPPLAHLIVGGRTRKGIGREILALATIMAGIALPIAWDAMPWSLGLLLILLGAMQLYLPRARATVQKYIKISFSIIVALIVALLLAKDWAPLGPQEEFGNIVFVLLSAGGLLGFFYLFIYFYGGILRWVLRHKPLFLGAVTLVTLFGFTTWLGFGRLTSWAPAFVKQTSFYSAAYHAIPGFGKEFMPHLDEGSFLWMPTTMTHASLGEVLEVMQLQDQAIAAIPEVETAVGKLGRAESPLDPAPVSMIETIINYKSEYITGDGGELIRFAFENGEFLRDEQGELIPHPYGRPYRQWRDHIRSADDIWAEIAKAAQVPGTTSAPQLQPIAARMVMLQSGMRAPMGLKVRGPDLDTIDKVALEIEGLLKEVPGIRSQTVFADRVVGKPYLEIDIDRRAIARYGMSVRQVQDVIEMAIGGMPLTTTIEGRERYPVRVRYPRELRGDIEDLERVLVPGAGGIQIPLGQLATINYVRGPQMIKSEDTFLVAYVIFDKEQNYAEVDVVEQAAAYLEQARKDGRLIIPAGVSYQFAGNYENQVRAEKRLRVILPISLLAIFLILYFQFKRVSTTLLVFSGIFVSWSGGFILVWLYGQPWFMDFSLFGQNLRDLFQMGTINLSVAVWVGFLALFGIATDDGVIIGTYLGQKFRSKRPSTLQEVREATVEAGLRRVRPATMTMATTVLALLPVLTSTGRGADVMVPMAIPTFGGMLLGVVTIFVVPTLYCLIEEIRLKRALRAG